MDTTAPSPDRNAPGPRCQATHIVRNGTLRSGSPQLLYRAGAVVYSDFWAAYGAAIPESQHVPCGKGDGMTCHVERFWCTVRQRCARFVRKTPSFSKCHWNHTGSLWYLTRPYNASLR